MKKEFENEELMIRRYEESLDIKTNYYNKKYKLIEKGETR